MRNLPEPQLNTPDVMDAKHRRGVRIGAGTAIAIVLSIGLGVLCVRLDGPFVLCVSLLLALPAVLFFGGMLWYVHVKYFPEYDYGGRTKEEIRALRVNPVYLRERRRVLLGRAFKWVLLVGAVAFSLAAHFEKQTGFVPIRTMGEGYAAMGPAGAACAAIATFLLIRDQRRLWALESIRYDREDGEDAPEED